MTRWILGLVGLFLVGCPTGVFALTVTLTCTGNPADDNGAVQAAIDSVVAASGGTVRWPDGTCQISQTIRLGAVSDTTTTFINLEGGGPEVSRLRWVGPCIGNALKISKNKYFKISGLAIIQASSCGGGTNATTGVLVGGTSPSGGTKVLASILERVTVHGFRYCITDGDGTGTYSEILFNTLALSGCEYGARFTDLNALDMTFVNLNCGGGGSNGYCVYSSTANVHVFGGSASSSTVADFYFSGSQSWSAIHGFRSELSNRFVIVQGAASVLLDSVIAVSGTNPDGVIIDAGNGVQFGRLTILNSRIDNNVRVTGSGIGVAIENSAVGNQPNPIAFSNVQQSVGLRFSLVTNAAGVRYPDLDGTLIGTAFAAASSLRAHRAERVWGQLAAGLPVTIGEQLKDATMLGSGTSADGRNLRVQWTFAGAGTATVTFKHPVTATYSGGTQTWTVSAGKLSLSDLGRRVKSPGPEVNSWVTAVNPTAGTFQLAASNCGSCKGIVIEIGDDEPDANYLLMLSANAPERISWSNKTAAGFTLMSDNPVSTVTVDVLVVR